MIVVTIPFEADTVEVLMMDVEEETPLIDEVSVLTAEVRALASTKLAVVVAILPLTVEVSMKELVEVEIVRVFEVEEATRLVRSVDVAIPFIVVVSIVPDVEISFDDITEDVAVTPFIVVVNVLPVRDWVKELIRVTTLEAIPLTIVCRKLGDEDAMLDVIIVDVPIEPPMFEVRVLLDEERVFEVLRAVMVAEEMVVVANCDVPTAYKSPVDNAVDEARSSDEEAEAMILVNTGLSEVAIVEVPLIMILLPAVK
jgi:hypothetical protein